MAVVVIGAACVAATGIAHAVGEARFIARTRFVADTVALAEVTGNRPAAQAMASSAGCGYTVESRSALDVVVRLGTECAGIESSATLRP